MFIIIYTFVNEKFILVKIFKYSNIYRPNIYSCPVTKYSSMNTKNKQNHYSYSFEI